MSPKPNFLTICLAALICLLQHSAIQGQETTQPKTAPAATDPDSQTPNQTSDGTQAADAMKKKKTPQQIAWEKSLAQRAILRARAARNREALRQRNQPWDKKWKRVTPENSNSSILMPMLPQEGTNKTPPVKDEPAITIHQFFSFIRDKEASFRLNYHDLNTVPKSRGEIKRTLAGVVEGAVALVGGQLHMNERLNTDEFQGIEFKYSFTLPDKRVAQIWSRAYLVDQRLYIQSVIMPLASFDNKLSRTFLDSFILNPEPTETPTVQPGNQTPAGQTGPGQTGPGQTGPGQTGPGQTDGSQSLKYPDAKKPGKDPFAEPDKQTPPGKSSGK